MSSIASWLIVAVALVGQGPLDAVEESPSDAALRARIETTFMLNDHLSPFTLKVLSEDGVITLSGAVQDLIQKDLAESIAMSHDGVSRVDNRITIAPGVKVLSSKRGLRRKIADTSISASVRTRLLYRKNLRRYKIRSIAVNKVVTLTGTVDTQFQKEEAGHVALQTKGVNQVINQLMVRGTNDSVLDIEDSPQTISDSSIEQQIEKSIYLNRYLGERQIDANVLSGVCYLTGSVRTVEEKRLAESIAINTRGVSEVRNDIRVQSDANLDERYLDVLEPLDALEPAPLNENPSRPSSGDTPLFSDGAKID